MNRYHYAPPRPFTAFLVAVGILAFLLVGCKTSHPHPDERPSSSLVAHPVALDSANMVEKHQVKPSLPARITDAIGLSTPAGRARRQQRKDAKAAVPRSIGKGAVWAPAATSVVNAYKPSSSTTANADSGAVVQNTQGGAAAAGPNAHAEGGAVVQEAKDWKAMLTGPLGYALAAVSLLVFGGIVWQLWPLLPKRKSSNQA